MQALCESAPSNKTTLQASKSSRLHCSLVYQHIYRGKAKDVQRFLVEGTAANCDTARFFLLLPARELPSSSSSLLQLLLSSDPAIMLSPSSFEKRELQIESLLSSPKVASVATAAAVNTESAAAPFLPDEVRSGLLLALLLV
jgi:hypothetical protein